MVANSRISRTNHGPQQIWQKKQVIIIKKNTCITFLWMILRSKKIIAYTFLPSLDNANGRLKKERRLLAKNFAVIVTWLHTSLCCELCRKVIVTDEISHCFCDFLYRWCETNRWGCSKSGTNRILFQWHLVDALFRFFPWWRTQYSV